MRRYIEHLKTKEPHERRVYALRWAGVITGLFFVAWVGTLGTRLALLGDDVAQNAESTQTAAAAAAAQEGSRLEVATTTPYSY